MYATGRSLALHPAFASLERRHLITAEGVQYAREAVFREVLVAESVGGAIG